jgi:hypothetical protein
MPQATTKKKPLKTVAHSKSNPRLGAEPNNPIEQVIIRCWEQDYELPEILSALHQYNLDTPALKSCVEWLLLTEKVVEYKLTPNAEQVSQQLEQIKAQVADKTTEPWAVWLEKQKTTEATIVKRLSFQDQLQQLKEVIVTEAAVKDMFLQQKSHRDSLVFQVGKFSSIETAQAAWTQLTQQSMDFTSLILAQTEVPQQGLAGLIGPVVCTQINPEVLRRIIRLEAHEYTDPFTVNGTEFMIARLLIKQLLSPVPQIIEPIKDQVFQRWIAEQVRLSKAHWRFYTGQEWLEASSLQEELVSDGSADEGMNGLFKSFGFLFGKKGGSV